MKIFPQSSHTEAAVLEIQSYSPSWRQNLAIGQSLRRGAGFEGRKGCEGWWRLDPTWQSQSTWREGSFGWRNNLIYSGDLEILKIPGPHDTHQEQWKEWPGASPRLQDKLPVPWRAGLKRCDSSRPSEREYDEWPPAALRCAPGSDLLWWILGFPLI